MPGADDRGFSADRRRVASSSRAATLRIASLRIALIGIVAMSLSLVGSSARAQPGMGGPTMGGGPPGAPGRKEKKEGPAEEAPKDKQALKPIEEVPEMPQRRRRIGLFDLHGYFRMRADYFHRLSLGLAERPGGPEEPVGQNKFFQPPVQRPEVREDDTVVGNDASCLQRLGDRGVSVFRAQQRCSRRQGFGSGNLRLRLEPTLHITDTVKVHSQLDLLDNVVLGSTPDSYAFNNPNAPIDLYTRSQVPPQEGVNSFTDSIQVKRAWGHIRFGFGLDLQFGRMPWSWGMGLVANHGNGYFRGDKADIIRHLDRDYGDSVDSVRLAFDLGKDRRRAHTLAVSWDWASSGRTTAQVLGPEYESGRIVGQSISAERFDNVYQWSVSAERRDDPEMLRRKLSLGAPVVNYGLISWIRYQDIDTAFGAPLPSGTIVEPDYGERLVARRAIVATPDFWMRVNWRTLRVELEAAGTFGRFYMRDLDDDDVESSEFFETLGSDDLRQRIVANFGYALEFKYGFFKDRFHIGFDQGFAMGDTGTSQFAPDAGAPITANDPNRTISNFRFNPAFNVDMLLFREILGTVSNAAYFKPWAAFYFFEHFSARIDIEYALAHRRASTLGNRWSYGVELDGALRYHDAREPIFVQVQYGVMFPLPAFNRLNPAGSGLGRAEDAKAVQSIQGQVGIRF
jgi:uncharacterized protein (TIGR04551 family)